MNEDTQSNELRRIVLVVGVDLSDVSEHLLAQTRALIRPVDEAEVHVVHVVHPDPLPQWMAHSHSTGSARANTEHATSKLQGLCDRFGQGARAGRANVVVHTPIGDAATELVQIASRVNADIILVEAHERSRRRRWHRSVLARLVRSAPCTVLTIRGQRTATQAGATWAPASAPPG
jgi:nucleotide-binding universal stress UspA family protein